MQHHNFRQSIISPSCSVWSCRPDIALTLVSTWPSGHNDIVSARCGVAELLCARMPLPCPQPVKSVLHQCPPTLPLPIGYVFVGTGQLDTFPRPSPWTCPSPLPESFSTKQEFVHMWCNSRADLFNWLAPLFNSTLLCDCSGIDCPASAFADIIQSLSQHTEK